MPSLAVADRAQIDLLCRESHALWGGGLSPADYRALWDDLQTTEWGRRFASYRVWVDDRGRVLSSMKVYRPRLRIGTRETRASVFGAVFTPRVRRRRGHARAMVLSALEQSRRSGEGAAFLFTDIGTAYYAAMGFRPLPAEEQWGRLPGFHVRSLDDWSVEPARAQDLPEVIRAHDAFCERRPLAFLRDETHWRFLRLRAESYFRRYRGTELRERFSVVRRGGRFAGYAITVEGQGNWNVREIGAADGSAEGMTAVLRVCAVRARRDGLRNVFGWLPPEVAERLPDWALRRRPRSRAIPMILPFGPAAEGVDPSSPESIFIPFQDQF